MGTKNSPGKYDCYEKAKDDEPMFTLLARDTDAPLLIRLWVAIKAKHGNVDVDKLQEAKICAQDMDDWLDENEEFWKGPENE